MEITSKTTKQELKDFLNVNAKAVQEQDKNLYDRIVYTGKMSKEDDSKVTKKELLDLVKEVVKVLGSNLVVKEELAPTEPVAENSVKKLDKGVNKKQKEVPEVGGLAPDSKQTAVEAQETSTEPVKEEKVDKKSAKKSLGKKKEQPKKDGVIDLAPVTNSGKAVQLAQVFPKTFEVEGSKYELAEDINSFDDLYDAINKDEVVVFAYYWTKRHLRQFPYFGGWLGQPKSFNNDLDLATAIYVSDEKVVSYQVSAYTEAVYTILPTDLEVVDGVRIAGGIEYQIYRKV